ncbi:MAG: double zinc ribbon domain-containing protein [Sulfitobacter sp.]
MQQTYRWAQAGLQRAVLQIYPPRCLTCGDLVSSDFGLCGPCWAEVSFIGGAVCDGCGHPLPGEIGDGAALCDGCLQEPKPWAQGRAALLYRGTGRKLVLSLKHGDRIEVARPVGKWMAQAVRGMVQPDSLIVPVPLHWRRMIKRRYNQSALLARAVARETGQGHCLDLLQRHKNTPPTEGKNREERLAMMADAITVNPKRVDFLAGRQVLLVDDVLTTGATLSACTKACIDAGSGAVRVVTLARVAKDT